MSHMPRNIIVRLAGLTVILCTLILGSGCTKSMTPGKMQWVSAHSDDQQRVGNTYLLRGWIGVFSEGIDNLTREINEKGVRAHVYQDDQWAQLAKTIRESYQHEPKTEPLVLVGHSYGADDALRVARELKKDNIDVDLVVTLDPVTPIEVPTNVKQCVNIYQSNGVWDKMPWLRGVPVKEESKAATQLSNYNIRVDRTDLLEPDTDHFNIEKKAKIHAEIVRAVTATCPPRWQWALTHGSNNAATPASAVVKPSAQRPVTGGTPPPPAPAGAGQRADGRASFVN